MIVCESHNFTMKNALRAFVICVALCFWATTAWGAADEIVVGISTGYPPYYYEDDGELTGICIDTVNSVAQSMGLRIVYRKYPWKRLLFNAEHGHVDAIMPLFRTKERDSFLYFSNLDLVQEENSLFTWKDNDVSFDGNFDSIKSHSIGVVSGYSYGEEFDQFEHFDKVVTHNDKHLIEMFKFNRFDVGIGSRDVVLFNAHKEGISSRIRFLAPHITEGSLYIGFSRKLNHGELSERFSMALQDFKLTDAYQEILNKYRAIE